MASNYPAGLDSFATTHVVGEIIQPTTDNDQADALNKIEAELGINPSGSFATVVARFNASDTLRLDFGVGVVIHGATAGTARPTDYKIIIWIGSVTPTNASNNDILINTA